MTVVLKLTDARGNHIKGESKVPGHVDEIDIEAWSWGVTTPVGAKTNILDLSIKKSFDLASPPLLSASSTNEILQQGILTVVDQQGDDFLVVNLKQVTVVSIIIAEDPNLYPPAESVALRFDEIELKYKGEDVVLTRSQSGARRKRKGSGPRR
jgi:type VI secretion system secreted protein Hcp